MRHGEVCGLPRPRVAGLDTSTTVPMVKLQEEVTTLAADKIAAVDAATHYALGLPS